jgi:hypothetical protein
LRDTTIEQRFTGYFLALDIQYFTIAFPGHVRLHNRVEDIDDHCSRRIFKLPQLFGSECCLPQSTQQ